MMRHVCRHFIHSATPKAVGGQSMSIEVNQVDEAISVAFQEASVVETFARRLEDRIGPIPGAKRLLPSRKYGQPLNTKAIRENLSLSSLIMKDSAELSHYLGLDPSVKQRLDVEKQARQDAADRMAELTAKAAAENQAARQRRERSFHAGMNPTTGRRHGY